MTAQQWSRSLAWIGVVGLLIGALDPMEGAFIVLPFAGALTFGALLSKSRHRVPLYWAFGSMALGVAVLLALSAIGGIGGNSGRSPWWGLLLIPYPLGWFLSLVYGVRFLREGPTPGMTAQPRT